MQRPPQGAVVAVFGIGDDRGQRDPRGAGPPEQRQRQAPFLVKGDRGGNPRTARGAQDRSSTPRADRARRPSARSRPPVQSAAVTATWQLATLPSAPQYCRATPTEWGPDFGKLVSSRIRIPVRAGVTVAQPLPHDLGLPRGMRDEVLEGLIGRRLADPRQHRRHRLARAVAQQAVDVLPQRHVLRPMTEAVLELIQPARQATQQRPRVPIEHWTAAYRTRATSTRPLTSFPVRSHRVAAETSDKVELRSLDGLE